MLSRTSSKTGPGSDSEKILLAAWRMVGDFAIVEMDLGDFPLHDGS